MFTFITTFILFSIVLNLLCYSGAGAASYCFRLNALNGKTPILPHRQFTRLGIPVQTGSA